MGSLCINFCLTFKKFYKIGAQAATIMPQRRRRAAEGVRKPHSSARAASCARSLDANSLSLKRDDLLKVHREKTGEAISEIPKLHKPGFRA